MGKNQKIERNKKPKYEIARKSPESAEILA